MVAFCQTVAKKEGVMQMIDLSKFSKKKSGLLELYGFEIDDIGNQIALRYDHSIEADPHAIDIDGLVEFELGCKIDIVPLSKTGHILGMSVVDPQLVPYYLATEDQLIVQAEDGNTIVMDSQLYGSLDESIVHKQRFVLGHEGGHQYLQADYLRLSGNITPCMSNNDQTPHRPYCSWTDDEIAEWQASRFSAAILMPTSAVKTAIIQWLDHTPEFMQLPKFLIEHISRIFDVSYTTAYIRLSRIDYFRYVFKNVHCIQDTYL
jgi:hypothetical protein